jgi:hypothetical protein
MSALPTYADHLGHGLFARLVGSSYPFRRWGAGQRQGVTAEAGIYFLGLKRQYKPKSSFL